MKPPTKKEVKEAAARSGKAALDVSIRKYLYFLQLSLKEVKSLGKKLFAPAYCRLCERYGCNSDCPLDPSNICDVTYVRMTGAQKELRLGIGKGEEAYDRFLSHVAQIYVELLQLRGKLE